MNYLSVKHKLLTLSRIFTPLVIEPEFEAILTINYVVAESDEQNGRKSCEISA
jgi:hypothetical protein